MARIFCISDLHYSINESDIYGEDINIKITQNLKTDRLEILFSALEELGGIDLLIFCGDIVLGNENIEDKIKSLDVFLKFLSKIENSEKIFNYTGDISKRILIVPGNHDINRNDKDMINKFKLRFCRYITPFTESKQVYRYAPIFIFDDIKLIIACESTIELGARKIQE